ncbi:hypothetical protein [Pseudomonas chlororaphis]|uniref:hypothetical protein n=1 Tax=Pseudomonas chlororaphis TaxID=587753 RepID=UPI0013DE4114
MGMPVKLHKELIVREDEASISSRITWFELAFVDAVFGVPDISKLSISIFGEIDSYPWCRYVPESYGRQDKQYLCYASHPMIPFA